MQTSISWSLSVLQGAIILLISVNKTQWVAEVWGHNSVQLAKDFLGLHCLSSSAPVQFVTVDKINWGENKISKT